MGIMYFLFYVPVYAACSYSMLLKPQNSPAFPSGKKLQCQFNYHLNSPIPSADLPDTLHPKHVSPHGLFYSQLQPDASPHGCADRMVVIVLVVAAFASLVTEIRNLQIVDIVDTFVHVGLLSSEELDVQVSVEVCGEVDCVEVVL
jgi:hypothetical protein